MISKSSKAADWFDLTQYNTMAVPVRAKGLSTVTSLEQLAEAIKEARKVSLPFIVLGEGSNTVFLEHYPGLVIVIALKGIDVVREDDVSITLRVGAGENWHQLVEHCVSKGWFGLENLALIPGLVGAAPIQNIGAYGVEVKDCIHHVEVFDVESQAVQIINNNDCRFGYRDSRFKNQWADTKIVTAVVFQLSKRAIINIDYPALAQYFNRQQSSAKPSVPGPKDVFQAVVEIRSEKLPSPHDVPNAGSFFKNPVIDAVAHQELKSRYPNLVSYPAGERFKLAAAWLIETAGWKNKEIGGIKVHDRQALVVINPERCQGSAIKKFASALQMDIEDKFGVYLEVEPCLIGDVHS